MFCREFTLNTKILLNNDPGRFGGSAHNRKLTDIFALVFMVLYLLTIIGLLGYCIFNSNIELLTNGYDDCGNICGKNNLPQNGCFGKNMEQKTFVLIKIDGGKECVENCTMPGTQVFYDIYCAEDEQKIPFYMPKLMTYWKHASLIFSIVVVLSYPMISFLVYYSEISIKYVFYGFPAIFLFVLIYAWLDIYILYNFEFNLVLFIILITITCLFGLLAISSYFILYLKKKLTSLLFQEAGKVIRTIPLLLLQPLISSVLITTIIIIVFYSYLWIFSFSYLDSDIPENSDYSVEYVTYPIAITTGSLLIYANILLYLFVKHCQCLVVSGCVAKWYFTKNGILKKPIRKTILNLLKYHLGTLCLGSAIFSISYILRIVVQIIRGIGSGGNRESIYTSPCHFVSETCLAPFRTCLDWYTRNAYTMTAIYGYNFCTATFRATKLFNQNIYNAATVTTFGDFYLIYSKMIIWLITNLILRISIVDDLFGFVFCAVLSYIITDCFISVFEVAVDTIFLCFCEDCLYNNGESKPYYMTANLVYFIEKANIFVDPVKWKDVVDSWEEGPKNM